METQSEGTVDELVSVERRAAEEYRTPQSIYQERHRGDGPPAMRVGKRLLYRRSDLERWRQSRIS